MGGVIDNTTTTAYVTLEPCCHVGGGIERLRKSSDDGDDNIGRNKIVVNVLGATPTAMIGKEKAATEACRELIRSFAKRVGRSSSKDSIVAEMTGARRRSL